MLMLDGLKSLFLEALNLGDNRYAKLALILRWNKECDKVWQYKNDLLEECKLTYRPKTGAWSNYSSTMMECSNCKKHVPYHRYTFCPHCGSKNKME